MKRKLLLHLSLTIVVVCMTLHASICHLSVNSLPKTSLIVLAMLIPGIFLLSRSLDKNIFKRLTKIKTGLNNIIQNPDSSPLIAESNDELASIISDINILHKEVNDKQKELIEARNDMELRVFRRTEELARSYEELKKENAERIKAEEEAEKHRKQLIQDDKLKTLGVLSAGVAHEINNPNNFIMLNTPILKDIFTDILSFLRENHEETTQSFGTLSLNEANEAVPLLLEGISSGSERITKIVSSLKRYSQKGFSDTAMEVNANSVIVEAMPLIENLIKNSTDNFCLELASGLKSTYGDGSQIEQVVVNLIQNSCFALESRDKAITIRTYNNHDEATITIEVEDEGKGIPDEFMEKIQDPFFTTRREQGGTGLGLSISTNIAREHNGELRFESKPRCGTTARLILPILQQDVAEN